MAQTMINLVSGIMAGACLLFALAAWYYGGRAPFVAALQVWAALAGMGMARLAVWRETWRASVRAALYD